MRVGTLVQVVNGCTNKIKPEVWVVIEERDDGVWEVALISNMGSTRWFHKKSLEEVKCE